MCLAMRKRCVHKRKKWMLNHCDRIRKVREIRRLKFVLPRQQLRFAFYLSPVCKKHTHAQTNKLKYIGTARTALFIFQSLSPFTSYSIFLWKTIHVTCGEQDINPTWHFRCHHCQHWRCLYYVQQYYYYYGYYCCTYSINYIDHVLGTVKMSKGGLTQK